MDNDDSWYNLIPHPVVHNKPLVFSPTRLSRQVCMYLILLIMPDCTHGSSCHNFGTMLNLAIIQKMYLKKLLELVNQNTDSYQVANDYSSPVYLDNFMSPEYFTDGFKQTFGNITYYLEKLGI